LHTPCQSGREGKEPSPKTWRYKHLRRSAGGSFANGLQNRECRNCDTVSKRDFARQNGKARASNRHILPGTHQFNSALATWVIGNTSGKTRVRVGSGLGPRSRAVAMCGLLSFGSRKFPEIGFATPRNRACSSSSEPISNEHCPTTQMTAEPLPNQSDGSFVVSDDPNRISFEFVHNYLANSYWSPGLPEEVLRRAMAGSLCFGGYLSGEQVAFGRVVTDKATFAYLCDVFVSPKHQGRGFGTKLIAAIMQHDSLQGLRRFMLATKDAHDIYRKHGFQPVEHPDRMMDILKPSIYQQVLESRKE
jgi:GNAT superfamily N-acetyltransferase